MNAHQPEAIAMMKKFYEQGGVTISEASMKKEFTTRPTYDLAGQLKIMQRPAGGASEVDGWFTKIGDFMQANGHVSRSAGGEQVRHRRVPEDGRRRSEAEGLREPRRLSARMRAPQRTPARVGRRRDVRRAVRGVVCALRR